MILLDTSVWIEVFRARGSLRLEAVADFDEVVTCLSVMQEVMQKFRDARAFRAARRQGLTVPSSVDCLIAACAARNGLTVLHRDRDDPLLATI
jgi:predicted nucleic acid-binding protein